MSKSHSHDAATALDLGPQAKLTPELQAYFDKCQDKLGFVPNVLQAYAFDNAKLKAFIDMVDDLMLADSGISKVEREMIAVAVSGLNRCFYCSTTHPAMLRLALQKEGRDTNIAHEISFAPLHAEISTAEKAMLEFALKVTLESHKIGPEDHARLRKVGFDDETIFEIAEIAAMFNLTNRLANATGIRPNDEYHAMGR